MERFVRLFARDAPGPPNRSSGTLALPFEGRQKTRQRAILTSGEPVGVFLPRGSVMRGGDRLEAQSGRVVDIEAAHEVVSTVRSEDVHSIIRAAYHLGNRHVWLQIGPGWLRYLADHVLDGMLAGMGLIPERECAPFEPEAGAYDEHHPPR